jgi:pyrroline-5-carboxylate reductase
LPHEKTIGFIGSGNMTRAIVGGLLEKGTPAPLLAVSDPDLAQLDNTAKEAPIFRSQDNIALIQKSDCIILSVKPQALHSVLSPLVDAIHKKGCLVISIAAGIPVSQIQKWLNGYSRVIRTMPNTPAQVGSGMTAILASPAVHETDLLLTESIFSAVGHCCRLSSEEQMDWVTAISGSGPAYFFLFMEALEAAAISLGLPGDTAQTLVTQTALGAAQLASHTDISFARLRENVTSKGGTTEQALISFESSDLRNMVLLAVQAAAARAKEMAEHFGVNT